MKTFKKFAALLVAALMVLAMAVPAMADDPVPTPAPTYDYPLTVTGLSEGDTVKFYKIVEWVGETSDSSDVSGWKAIAPYNTVLTKAVLTSMLVGDPNASPSVAPTGMTSDLAGKIAALATGGEDATSISGGTATYNNATSGMYLALVTPKDANTIYNPVFVSADYNKETGHEGTAAVTGQFADSVAKKSTVTVSKTAENTSDYNSDHAKTTAVGDTVTFTVNTQIPGYGNVYTTPHFDVVDTLTDLKLKADTVTVTVPAGLTKGTDYTVTPDGTEGYRLSFSAAYLKTVKTATPVTITYDAEVTSSAALAINEESNDVYVEYSHNPNSQSDYDVKKDTTQHYTFTLDAEGAGLGSKLNGKKTSELVKIGVDAAGNPITTTTETSEITSSESWKGPLQNAQFGIWKSTDSGCTGTPFMTASTGEDGRLTFAGLDAGTYYLKEISAPDGYVTNTTIHTVVIAAQTDSVKVTEWWNGSAWVSEKPATGTAKEVTYDTDVLKSYTVKVDGEDTATYTFTNAATANDNDIKWETVEAVEKPFELENVKGTELPSTGGMGTTILYVAGSILVLAAGILLVTKRRMNAED